MPCENTEEKGEEKGTSYFSFEPPVVLVHLLHIYADFDRLCASINSFGNLHPYAEAFLTTSHPTFMTHHDQKTVRNIYMEAWCGGPKPS